MNLGQLLHLLEAQAQKTCDRDLRGCGQPNIVQRLLQRRPGVYCIQLAWEQLVDPGDVADTLAAVDETIELGAAFVGRCLLLGVVGARCTDSTLNLLYNNMQLDTDVWHDNCP